MTSPRIGEHQVGEIPTGDPRGRPRNHGSVSPASRRKHLGSVSQGAPPAHTRPGPPRWAAPGVAVPAPSISLPPQAFYRTSSASA
ncbi:hypothetical protein MSMEI_4211 [Mycolicibacterium smegmatis MC2 155]|uniref:Uncharacterized protein n=1 Tax=Mycolicibacterium smegmatis (strain ATCC 700084 / mc(2)155) TaxID=246196 RepID=I7FPM3_MYCS2|nr:hypothetical protein MSMEI_4211 [Mycolicibacterium smegmatis MC2 155]